LKVGLKQDDGHVILVDVVLLDPYPVKVGLKLGIKFFADKALVTFRPISN